MVQVNEPLTVQEAPAIYQVTLDSPRIKHGYKQTEVGVIPEDWQASEVGTLDPFVTSGSRGWADFYSELGSPFIRITNMSRDSIYLDLANLKQVKLPVHANEGKRTKLQNDDVLISITADIGIASFIDDSLTKPAYINQHIALVRFNSDNVSSKFITYYLASESAQRRFLSSTDQGAKAGMTLGGIKKIQLAIPPENEQRAIATALSDVDALLAAQDKLIAKKRDIKQAAMQQLLTGKQRLPGFSGEWEVKRLGDVVEIWKGQLITEKDAVTGSFPVIAGGKKPAYYHNKPNRTGKTITVSASGASAGYVAFFHTPIFASDCSTINEGQTYSIEFIFFQLQFKQDVIYKAQTGGAQPHIHAVDLIPIEIGCPSLQEQTTIATILSDMDADLTALEQQRDKTQALKQGMMQQLLTGKIRLI